jgi:hypothetical protein
METAMVHEFKGAYGALYGYAALFVGHASFLTHLRVKLSVKPPLKQLI